VEAVPVATSKGERKISPIAANTIGASSSVAFFSPSPGGTRLRFPRRTQRNGGLAREQEEGECLLKIEADDRVGVAQVTDRHVLAEI
jgi:hypothetical protein